MSRFMPCVRDYATATALFGALWLGGCATYSAPVLVESADAGASVNKPSADSHSDSHNKAPYLPSLLFVGSAGEFVGWRCTPSQDLVTAAQQHSLRLWSAQRAVELPQSVVASGTRYQQGDLSVWLKGDEGIVESERGRLECQAVTRRDSLRRSDKPGVMFYARGNQPGWSLELANDVPRIRMSLERGERQVDLPYRVTTLDNDAARVILASGRSDAPFELRIEAGACFDTLSDTPWPTKVTMQINGQQLQGCGQGIAP